MPPVQNNSDNLFLYGSLATLPVILGGVIVGWQIGITFYSVLVCLLLIFWEWAADYFCGVVMSMPCY